MSKQPEALRLADALERNRILPAGDNGNPLKDAAAELRRLHSVNAEMLEELRNIAKANPREWDEETRDQFQQWAQSRARHTITKATGGAA